MLVMNIDRNSKFYTLFIKKYSQVVYLLPSDLLIILFFNNTSFFCFAVSLHAMFRFELTIVEDQLRVELLTN